MAASQVLNVNKAAGPTLTLNRDSMSSTWGSAWMSIVNEQNTAKVGRYCSLSPPDHHKVNTVDVYCAREKLMPVSVRIRVLRVNLLVELENIVNTQNGDGSFGRELQAAQLVDRRLKHTSLVGEETLHSAATDRGHRNKRLP
jgi:hypothetical protein